MGSTTKINHLACLLLAPLVLFCAEADGPVFVDSQWNLTCPQDSEVSCGSLAPDTCLGPGGERMIVGSVGQPSCTGDPIIASCQVLNREDGRRLVFLEADIDDQFGLELAGATVNTGDGSMEQANCNVTITEDGLAYDVGGCGLEEPSMEQPCQLSNIEVSGNEVAFDLECRSLISSVTGNGFDVGALGGGPTTIRFANCAFP